MPSWKKLVLHGSSGSLAHLKLENLTSQNVLGTDAQGNVVAGSVSGYTLPTATSSVLGGIKVGGTLTISNGVLSARTYVGATPAAVGGGDGTDGVAGYVPTASSAESTLFLRGDGTWQTPANTVTRLRQSGGTLVAGDFTFAGSGATTVSYSGGTFTISSTDTNTTYSVGDGGLTEKNFTTALKSKLDGIAANADNYSGWTISDSTNTESIGSGDTLIIRGSGATTVSYNAATNVMTVSSTDTDTNTTYSAGTGLTLSGTTFSVTANTYAAANHNHDSVYLKIADTGSIIDYIVAAAPGTLDTLNEIAAAIGDDANFSASIASVIAGKANSSHTHAISDVTGLQTALDGKAASNHTHNYDNYGFWKVTDGVTEYKVESSGSVRLEGAGATTVSLSGGVLTITSTDNDTTYSQATSSTLGLVKIGYTANAKNYPVQLSSGQMYVNVPWTDTDTDTVTAVGVPNDLSTGNIEIRGSGATTVTKSGNTITIESTDNDTNTVTSVGVSGDLSTGNVTLAGSGATSISKSGGTITISSTDTNTTYSAGTGLTLSGTTFSVTAGTYASASHTHGASSITSGTFGTGHYLFPYQSGITGATAPSYTQGAIELYTDSNHVPAIGFHRGGYSATTLYEYDGQLYANAWTTRAQTGLLLSTGNIGSYAAAVSHTHDAATSAAAGFMSAADKSKLDGVAANANNYSLPTATASVLGGIKVGTNLSISSGVLSATDTVTAVGVPNDLSTGNIEFRGSGATTVTKSGNTITIESTDTDTDTNTVTSVGVSGDLSTGNITLVGSGATSITKSGGTITISSTDTDTNTTYSAGTGLTLSGTTFSVTAGTYAAASHTHDDRYYTETESNQYFGAFGRSTLHGAYSDFNTSPGFGGWSYVIGTTNSGHNGTQGGYRLRVGLGSDYSIDTTSGAYAMELNIPRTNQGGTGTGYLFLRQMENGSWASWSKISAGYADSAGAVAWTNVSGRPTNVSSFTNDAGYITSYTDTNTVTSVGVSGDLSTGNITLVGSGATSISKSSGTITISSTDTNTTYSAGTGLTLSGTTFSVTAGTYAAASHNHDDRYYTEAEVDSLLSGKVSTDTVKVLGGGISYDTDRSLKVSNGLAIYGAYNGGANAPFTYDIAAQFAFSSRAFELAADWINSDGANLKLRTLRDCCQNWSPWVTLLSSYNFTGWAQEKENQRLSTSNDVTFTSTTGPIFLVNNHSDNTKGYRIHNTSGTSVSAMFVNSSNQLVIAAGSVDQINLNKKVYVNGVALGVNIAASATAGRIDASNDIVAYSTSDERLKENITPIENALDKVRALTGVEFDWKPEYKQAHGYEGHDTGIIAQQVQAVMPTAIRENETGYLSVRYEKLIGLLIEGMKEQQAQIDELKAQINDLTK